VLKTYNQIRDSWMSLYDPENRNGLSMGIIHSHFNEPQFDLDLRKPAPEDLHEQIDADNLLREFETILGGTADEQVEPQPQPQSRERREVEAVRRDARRHGRGGGFGLAARNTFKSTLEASKKALRTNLNGTTGSMSSDHTSEHIESWRETQSNLEAKTNNWRTNNLSVVPFANSRFSELRNRHIQQPASELDTNGRTP
jgi:hypothetical protein